MSGGYPPGVTQRMIEEAAPGYWDDPEAPELEPCDHCHAETAPEELHRVFMDFLCEDCFAAYVSADEVNLWDETLADMISYRQRVL